MKIQNMFFVLLLTFSCLMSAHALEFVSVADGSAILYDAPSAKAKKLYVISRHTPLEKVVNLQDWIKVRDSFGTMAWVERRAVTDERRFVVVTVPLASVRQEPDLKSPVAFQLSQNVLIESLGINGAGWIKARHQDGSSGYLRSIDVWGTD